MHSNISQNIINWVSQVLQTQSTDTCNFTSLKIRSVCLFSQLYFVGREVVSNLFDAYTLSPTTI